MNFEDERIVRTMTVSIFFRKIANPAELKISKEFIKGMGLKAETLLDRELESRCLRCGISILPQHTTGKTLIHLCAKCNKILMKIVSSRWQETRFNHKGVIHE